MRPWGITSKKFRRRVLPGALLVRASARRCVIALMALDLPAFERPAKATSAPSSAGNWDAAAALTRNRTSGNRLIVRTQGCQAFANSSVQFAAFAQVLEDAEKVTMLKRKMALAAWVLVLGASVAQ